MRFYLKRYPTETPAQPAPKLDVSNNGVHTARIMNPFLSG